MTSNVNNTNHRDAEERFVLTNNGVFITLSENGRIGTTTNPAEATSLTRKQANRFCDGGWGSKKARGFVLRPVDDVVPDDAGADGLVIVGHAQCSTKRKPIAKTTKVDAYNRAEGRCAICGRFVPCDEFTIDHVVPISCGGDDGLANLQMTCLTCNKMKSDLMTDDMMRHIVDILHHQISNGDSDGSIARMVLRLAEDTREHVKQENKRFACLRMNAMKRKILSFLHLD